MLRSLYFDMNLRHLPPASAFRCGKQRWPSASEECREVTSAKEESLNFLPRNKMEDFAVHT